MAAFQHGSFLVMRPNTDVDGFGVLKSLSHRDIMLHRALVGAAGITGLIIDPG